MDQFMDYLPEPGKLVELTITYGGKLLLALITLIIGLWLINKLVNGIKKMFIHRSFDETLQTFLLTLISITLKILLVISIVNNLGVQMTSFIAVLGAAGLAVGMALSGTLQNFAGGVVLLILKPFKVGNYIEAQGFAGTVKEIQIFTTILNTPDKKTIIIPNGPLSSGTVINYSKEPTRRVEWTFGISYNDSIDAARKIILEILQADSRVLADPAPMVVVASLGDSSVDLKTRVWVESANFWSVFFDINEKVKKEFDSQGISIPFPQRDVHLFQTK